MHRLKFYILFILVTAIAHAQQPQVEASVDSVRIKIGSQANLTLKANVDNTSKVVFPNAKNIGLLEVIESYPVDTLKEDGKYSLVKKYGLTQFDSGHYSIPSLSIEINGRNYTTQALKLEVNDIVVDTTRQKMFDIKPIASQDSGLNFWWYMLVLAGFIIIAFAVWWDINRRKKRLKPEITLSPIDRAMGSLKRFDHSYAGNKGDSKTYYSELTAILRLYIEETLHIPAMESTTTGLMDSLESAAAGRKMVLPEEIYSLAQRVLKNADLVKFALSRPPEQQINDDRAATERIINTMENAIPLPTQEETEQSEAYKQQQLLKKERKKRALIIACCSVLVIGSLAYLGFNRVYGYLQENFIGYSTEELWEGEWVKSEYGNPAITISTPKVLKREDIAPYMSKQDLANLQEIQYFGYGAPFGNFFVTIKTMNFMPGIQPDVNSVVENAFRSWESQGARNITTNTERFVTDDGFEGIRAFGHLTLSTNSDARFYYEMVSFQQLQGLQQVLIMREDQDEFGIRIAEKIKKSIQYKKVR